MQWMVKSVVVRRAGVVRGEVRMALRRRRRAHAGGWTRRRGRASQRGEWMRRMARQGADARR
jgi:hypothetical protein